MLPDGINYLKLKKVKTGPLQSIIMKIGGPEYVNNPEKIKSLTGKRQWDAIQAVDQLFNYCAGWGVDADPPLEDNELLIALGADLTQAHLTRALWIRQCVFDSDVEAGQLVGAVMALAYS